MFHCIFLEKTTDSVKSMVVEITPIGITNLKWRFYIIWTVFNLAFVPIVYFLYPEVTVPPLTTFIITNHRQTADRSLEDVDRFFTENQKIIIFRDKEATAAKRPAHYWEMEEREVRRHSSVASRRESVVAHRSNSNISQKRNSERDGVGEKNYGRA